MTKISIVIPCYNHGQYIREAIESIEQYPDKSVYEIIIVNDGSTDPYTIQVMEELGSKGYHVINQHNQGLGAARNNGIRKAAGKYILPLDSDNKIRTEYIQKGIEILESHPKVGVVYGDSLFFGDENKINRVPDFNLTTQLRNNYIDACAVFRKEVWEQVGGFDEKMPIMGYEDWDFWLSVATKGWQFYHVKEVLFDYRVRGDSMVINTRRADNRVVLLEYMGVKHIKILRTSFEELYNENKRMKAIHRSIFPLCKALGKNIKQRVLGT